MSDPVSVDEREPQRLKALRALDIVGTPPEPHFDAVCRTAAALFGMPIALVSLVEEDGPWFKARHGLSIAGVPRDIAFCTHAILSDTVLVVEDATRDPRFRKNALVAGAPGIRFYAGAPLVLEDGLRVGTLCVMDVVARTFSAEQCGQLADLAAIVLAHLHLHAAHSRGRSETAKREVREAVIADQAAALRQREARLIESESRFRLLIEGLTDCAICMLDPAGIVTDWHVGGEGIYGYRAEDIIGSHVSRLYPDGDREAGAPQASIEAARREGRARTEGWRQRSDGTRFWASDLTQPIREAGGTLLGFALLTRDVTDQRQAAQALQLSETRYRILADTLPQMVWTMDSANPGTVYVNRPFEAYHGPIGTSLYDRLACYHPDDVTAVEGAWRQGLVTRTAWEAEARLMRKDGAYRWHRLMIAPIQDGEGSGAWLGTALDIHDAVTAQEALLQSTDLLRIAQTAAGAGAWDVDLVSDTIILSPESAAMHGFDAGAAVTMTSEDWSALAHPEDVGRVWSEIRRSVATRETYRAEFRVPQPNGDIRWIEGIGRAYYDAHGNPVRLTGLNFDVDQRKSIEAALIEASRAADLARLEAEKASAAKSEFLAAMSHEIRTPLNSILGYTELLLSTPAHEPLDRSKLDRVLGSGRALLTVVNDVLDFSKIEAGRVELEPEAFGLSGLIADTLSMIGPLAADKALSLRADVDPRLPQGLMGDQNRLRQVLLNLMNNAVKFTRSGEVVLTMRAERRTRRSLRLRCEVSDTGIGVPADKRDLLFQRFSQIDRSISRRFGGTGLGLAISKSLVELMGGRIGIEDRPGPGSTFWFTAELGIAEVAPVRSERAATPAASLRRARVLLVEDVAMNRDIAKTMLMEGGHHVDIACDGAEAVQAVQDGDYDIVLMDVQMPVMDGIEATARIRSMSGPQAQVPIVALTANVLTEQVAAFREAGMTDHVGKPFRRSDLLAVIGRWVAGTEDGEAEFPDGAVDRTTFDELADLLGHEKLARMLGDLEAVLRGGFVLDPATGAARDEPDRDLAGIAHKLISSAGMLGFATLSETCRNLERASRAGRLARSDIESAAEASRSALAAVDALRRDLDRAAASANAPPLLLTGS